MTELTMRGRLAAVLGAGVVVSASLAGQIAAAPTPKLCSNSVKGAAYSYKAVGGAALRLTQAS
jgi:hypothetical protein